MLKKFSVKNFKGFKEEIVFDLSRARNYSFNEYCVSGSLVKKSILYGKNASGKSNLGLALFDIVGTITDKHPGEKNYSLGYLNANSSSKYAEFKYVFELQGDILEYSYAKSDFESISLEKIVINGEVLIDLTEGRRDVKLPGAENLILESDVGTKISVVRYIRKNSPRIDDKLNIIFHRFFDFVERMLYFRSLRDNSYVGYEVGSYNIFRDVAEKNQVKEFQNFLEAAGISLELRKIEDGDKPTIGVYFESTDRLVPLSDILSTGTLSLSLFFFWLRKFKQVSFLFIDEFDAYYHHELAKFVTERVLSFECQSVLTTHNTSLMSNQIFRPDACFILARGNITSVNELTEKELREAHNLEKMYVSGSFAGV